MALKLRRQAKMFTNRILPHRQYRREPDSLSAGADSLKRLLGCARSNLLLEPALRSSSCAHPINVLNIINAEFLNGR